MVEAATGALVAWRPGVLEGNRAAVLTLWKVDDKSSSRFVSAFFFQRVAKEVPPLQALAATKREFAGTRRYGHPVHWAGFVMYGG